MSFKLRNTLFLLFLALAISAFGVWRLVFVYPKMINSLESQIAEMDVSIVQIPELEATLELARNGIAEREEKLAQLDKTVEKDITLADAFAYLDDIQDRYGSIQLTVTYMDDKSLRGFGSRGFTLTGEGTYHTIFSLIWALERGPKVFTIDKLNMRGVEAARTGNEVSSLVVPFEMTVRALFADVSGLPPITRTLQDVRVPWIRNMFYPLISTNLPPNTKGLVEVERSELRALLPGRAILADNSGKIHVLSEGDEVYLGYLTKIDIAKNLVEFTLNKGGIVERFRLNLQFTAEEGE